MDLQKTGRKNYNDKTPAFRSKPTHQDWNFTQNRAETKAAQERKLKTNETQNTAAVKTACEDLMFLQKNTPKKSNNEIT